jgi:hypothetical protein
MASPPLKPDVSTAARRTLLKGGAAFVVAVAFPAACDSPPLPEPSDGGGADNTGEGGGSAGGNAGSNGAAGQAPPANCSSATAAGLSASAVNVGSLVVVGGDLVVGRDAGGFTRCQLFARIRGVP